MADGCNINKTLLTINQPIIPCMIINRRIELQIYKYFLSITLLDENKLAVIKKYTYKPS